MFTKTVFAAALLSLAQSKKLKEAITDPEIDTNQQPVIGILTQQLDESFANDPRFEGYDSYLMAAYVKFLETAGARVVPLILGEPEEVTLDKLSKLDGVLFPGGDGDYIDFGGQIISRIMEYNDQGHFYPAWGTCLGFESMMVWASSDGRDVMEEYNAHAISETLQFVVDPRTTEMFGDLGDDAFKFETKAMTLNSHSFGIDPVKFITDKGLASMYKLTSISYEPEGDKRPFTASVEGKKYPFFATQFHPEKTTTMFLDDAGINHSWESIQMNRYFADKFVSLARRNPNTFGDYETTQAQIVANYDLIVTDTFGGEVYVFNSAATRNSFLQ